MEKRLARIRETKPGASPGVCRDSFSIRRGGGGDFFERARAAVLRREAIHVDFTITHYNHDFDTAYQALRAILTLGGAEKMPKTLKEYESLTGQITESALRGSVAMLNTIYAGRREIFQLRGVKEVTLEEIRGNKPEGRGKSRNYFEVDVSLTLFGTRNYDGNGMIFVDPAAIVDPEFYWLLPHEIGHGIFGAGHCGASSCIMSASDYDINSQTFFCGRESAVLSRLSDGITG
ncbi:MAG: hypothetical protein AABZ57_06550 [Candidatus Margulisiibacteriota bacterium]